MAGSLQVNEEIVPNLNTENGILDGGRMEEEPSDSTAGVPDTCGSPWMFFSFSVIPPILERTTVALVEGAGGAAAGFILESCCLRPLSISACSNKSLRR